MRRPLLFAAAVLGAPMLWGCAVVGAGVHAVHSTVDGVAHMLAFGPRDDNAPMAYTKDALAEAAVLYPPALTTVIVAPNHPRLTAAVRAAGYAVTDRDGPAAADALPVHFTVHTGAAGVDVAVLQIGDQVLTRGYMAGQPATGWTYDARNAPPRTVERLQMVERGIPVDRLSYAYAGADRQVDAPQGQIAPPARSPQP